MSQGDFPLSWFGHRDSGLRQHRRTQSTWHEDTQPPSSRAQGDNLTHLLVFPLPPWMMSTLALPHFERCMEGVAEDRAMGFIRVNVSKLGLPGSEDERAVGE